MKLKPFRLNLTTLPPSPRGSKEKQPFLLVKEN